MSNIAIHNKSSERMDELADGSVALMVTSPPYNVGLEYEDDLAPEDHLALIERVLRETWRVLKPGGRIAINVSDIGRDPFYDLTAEVSLLTSSLGYTMRGKIVWHKGNANGTAWGSFTKATAPVLRDNREFVLIFSKGAWKLPKRHSTITNEEFTNWTQGLWTISPETDRSHPAPFPVELPWRLINLYSFGNDLVLDPFMGSGTTGVAALKAGRRFVGYELEPRYIKIAEARLQPAMIV